MRVKAPKNTEDPEAKAAREREQARADAAFVENTQELLDDETRRRVRRLGRRAALSGVSPGGGFTGGFGGGSFSPIGTGLSGGGLGGGSGLGGSGGTPNREVF